MYAAKRVKTERRLSGKQEQTRRPAKPHIYTATNHTMRQQKIKGKSVLCGGARRNRTADNGFADHCLTTWRPRHRTGKLSVLSQKKMRRSFCSCTCKLLVMNSPLSFRMVFSSLLQSERIMCERFFAVTVDSVFLSEKLS